MAEPRILLDIDDGVAVVRLNAPETLNALTPDMARALSQTLVEAGQRARATVLTGQGRAFCAGADLSQIDVLVSGDGPQAADFRMVVESIFNPLVETLRSHPVPLVTAVHGAAAGGGSSLALLGDLIVASEDAYFLQAFARIGLVPDCGASYLLPRQLGKARATELMLLGDKLPARQALEWGLINRCVAHDDVLPTALALAQRLAKGPASLGLTRQLIWDSLAATWPQQLQREALYQGLAGQTQDSAEGRQAFLEKRPAVFVGR